MDQRNSNSNVRSQRNSFSSLAASVTAYQPYYAPPIPPERSIVQSGGQAYFQNSIPNQTIDQHTTTVNREPRTIGIRWLYSYGAQKKQWFQMVATGQVQSSKFQSITSHRWSGEFNDAIYQAGYPRNTGYTFKAPQIPAADPLSTMTAKPHITRSYYSRRAYTSGLKPVALQSTTPASVRATRNPLHRSG